MTASLDGLRHPDPRSSRSTATSTGVDFDFVKTTGAITGTRREQQRRTAARGQHPSQPRRAGLRHRERRRRPTPGRSRSPTSRPARTSSSSPASTTRRQSQIVTVAAGQVVDLGRIVLEFRERPDIPQNGSLEVRVVDSRPTPLNGADRPGRRRRAPEQVVARAVATPAGAQSSFVFQPTADRHVPRRGRPSDLTYRLSAARGCRSGSGRQSRGHPAVPARSGVRAGRRLVHAAPSSTTTTSRSSGSPGGRNETQRRESRSTPAPGHGPDQDQIRWETPPTSLTSGIYRVRGQPAAGLPRACRPGAGRRAAADAVRVSPTDDTPIMLADIQADLFPEPDRRRRRAPARPVRERSRSCRSTTTASSCRSAAARSAR